MATRGTEPQLQTELLQQLVDNSNALRREMIQKFDSLDSAVAALRQDMNARLNTIESQLPTNQTSQVANTSANTGEICTASQSNRRRLVIHSDEDDQVPVKPASGRKKLSIQESDEESDSPSASAGTSPSPRRKLIIQDDDEEDEDEEEWQEAVVVPETTSTSSSKGGSGRRKLVIEDSNDCGSEQAAGRQKLPIHNCNASAPSSGGAAAPERRTKLLICDDTETENDDPPATSTSNTTAASAEPRGLAEPRGVSKEQRLKQAQTQLAALRAKEEEDELQEVNPSDWMQNRRKAAGGQTFDASAYGAGESTSSDESEEEEMDWRAQRRAMMEQRRGGRGEEWKPPQKSASATEAPFRSPTLKDLRNQLTSTSPMSTPRIEAAASEEDQPQEEEFTREGLTEQQLAEMSEEERVALAIAASQEETPAAAPEVSEDDWTEGCDAEGLEDNIDAVLQQQEERKKEAERRKEVERARLKQQAEKREIAKKQSEEARQEQEKARAEQEAQERERERIAENERKAEEARLAAEKAAHAAWLEQEAFEREQRLLMQLEAEEKAREYAEFVAHEKALELGRLERQASERPAIDQLCHSAVSRGHQMRSLPAELWDQLTNPEEDDLYGAQSCAVNTQYTLLEVKPAQAPVLADVLCWVLSSFNPSPPEVYPPPPELPGKLVGLMLSSSESQPALLIGLECTTEAVQSLEETISQIMLHDVLSGESLSVVSPENAKMLSLANIAHVRPTPTDGSHPLQLFACQPALWLDGASRSVSCEGIEHSVALVKPHCLQTPSKLAAVLRKPDSLGLTIAGVRLLWLSENDSAAVSCFSPFCSISDHPVVVLAVRGIQAVDKWLAATGPEDPLLARRTDPDSLRAVHGETKALNLLACTRANERSLRDMALFFGGRLQEEHSYVHEAALPLVSQYQPSRCLLAVRPDLSISLYGQLLGSLKEHNMQLQLCTRVELPEAVNLQLDYPGSHAATHWLLLRVVAELAAHRVACWKASLPEELKERVTECNEQMTLVLDKHLVDQLPAPARKPEQVDRDAVDDSDEQQAVVASVMCSASDAQMVSALIQAVPEAKLLGLKRFPAVAGWTVKLLREQLTEPEQLSAAKFGFGCMLVAMRGYGVRSAWAAVAEQHQGSIRFSGSAQAAHCLLQAVFDASEVALPKAVGSLQSMFAPADMETAVLCIKGNATQRSLPKVFKMLRSQRFETAAALMIRYTEVQPCFEQVYAAAAPSEMLAVLMLLRRPHAKHSLSNLLQQPNSAKDELNSLPGLFGADCFSTPSTPQLQERVCAQLQSSALDMAASRYLSTQPAFDLPHRCELTQGAGSTQVLDRVIREGYRIVAMRILPLSTAEIRHYGNLSGHSQVSHQDGEPCMVMALERDNGMAHFASLLGRGVQQSAAWKMRDASLVSQFGDNIYSSTRLERARKELAFFFSDMYGKDQIGAAHL